MPLPFKSTTTSQPFRSTSPLEMASAGGSFQVKVISKTLIKASDTTIQPYVLHPSNLDHLPSNIPSPFITIYPKPPSGGDYSSVAAILRRTLPTFLNYFFPFTGRIRPDENGVPEVHCNNEGAELVVARADIRLADVNFHDKSKSLEPIQLPYDEQIPLSIQVVGFACGGFSIVWGGTHLLSDGHGLSFLPTLWTEYVRTGQLSRIPNHDRSIFRPRSPPTYSPETDRSLACLTPDDLINSLSAGAFVKRLYHVEGKHIDRLRELASREGRGATRMEAFSAYLWKALATAVGDSDVSCRMAWLVDARQRLGPKYAQAMKDYMGNVITFATKEAGVAELVNGSYSQVAGMASAAVKEVADNAEDHFQEMIDWVESHKLGKRANRVQVGLGSPALVVSSFHHIGLNLDFGLGQPALAMADLPWGRLGSAFVIVLASPKGDGSLYMNAYIWSQLADVLESDPDRVFKPATAEDLGLVEPASHQVWVSRL
uniref:Hydroxycinnamoyltransferase 1 n=1 Tax=Elaeis guineensis var. tenera TaxID=51953 RepID=A0A6I9SHJ0_ELAGV|nr:hydroxycinnamoyltransferase 1 [Elaeis guineensis]